MTYIFYQIIFSILPFSVRHHWLFLHYSDFFTHWKCCNSILWWHSSSGVISPKNLGCQNAWF